MWVPPDLFGQLFQLLHLVDDIVELLAILFISFLSLYTNHTILHYIIDSLSKVGFLLVCRPVIAIGF
jgi:hypothetical protein